MWSGSDGQRRRQGASEMSLWFLRWSPHAGSGVVRIDPLRFLAGMSYKATKPGVVSVLYLSMRYNCGIVVY